MAASLTASDGEVDFRSIGRALWRRKRWIVIPTLLAAVLSTVAVNLIAPRYKSEARVLFEGRENVFLRPEADRSLPDTVIGDQEAITNQVQIVLSREVALDVIQKLKLAERPEFDSVLGGISPLKYLAMFFGLSRDPFQMTPEERVLESYYDRLSAFAVERSRVIVIEFQSRDPELAARVANAIAEDYITRRQSGKEEQNRAASQWLAGEIDKLRSRVAEAEARTEAFRSRSSLFVGSNNTSLSSQQLGELTSQLTSARAQKTDADTRAAAIRALLRRGDAIEASDVANSELMRRLSEQRVMLRAQLAEQSSTLLDEHPRIKELRAQLADLDKQMRGEAERLGRAFESDARIAGQRVDALAASLDQMKKQAATSNEQDVQLRALDRESKAQRDLLESYLAKYREATARESIGSTPPSDARVISHAIVSNTPYFPKKVPTILIATLAAFALSAGLVMTGEVLRADASAAVVARLPAVAEDAPPLVVARPRAAAAPEVAPRGEDAAEAEEAPPPSPRLSDRIAALRRMPVVATPVVPAAPAHDAPKAEVAASAPETPLRQTPPDAAAVAAAGSDATKPAADGGIEELARTLGRSIARGTRITVVGDDVAAASRGALMLARALGGERRVVLADLTPHNMALATASRDPGTPGITDLVRGDCSFGDVIARDRQSGLHIVSAGPLGNDLADMIGSFRFVTTIEALAQTYDMVVIGAANASDKAITGLAVLAPRAVLLASDGPDTLRSARERLVKAGFAEVLTLTDPLPPESNRPAAA